MKISIKVLLVFFALMGGFSKTYASKTILGASVFNPTDVTNEIRNAINSSVDTVIIQNVGQPWIVQPLTFFNKDAITIIFEPGVILQAKSGAFTQTYATLFKLKDCTNFKIYGYGATFKMLKTEYTTGEWRHAVDLSDCTNITIAGLMVNDSGGDGLLITGYAGGTNNQNFCENIYVVNCVFDNNRRQGCSIISAKNVLIENCTFSNTKGTLPEAGLDIEPDFPEQFVQNIKIRKCRFTNNYGAGLVFAFHLLNSSSPTVSVTVENSYFSFNHDITNVYATTEIQLSEAPNVNLTGQIVFNKCFVDGSNWTSFYVNKGNNGLTAAFNDCVFKDVSQNTANVYNNPIWIEIPGDYVSPLNYYLGGITFTNSLLTYSTNYKFAWINGWTNLPGAKGHPSRCSLQF
ncbi:MAG: right-handed parallel beta-helix repeat-containing protein [Cytophagales bacterium]|nr:MAG: right-handed parallel beta-helix repeat-containing protein [Cytophagales bacterium]